MELQIRTVYVLLMMIGMLLATHGLAGAATPAEARSVMEANQAAVVWVELVVEMKMSYEGQTHTREHKASTNGTVIDPSGLTVISLSESDPSSDYSEDDAEGGKVTANIVSAKMRNGDSGEIAAEVIMRDRDLDMAFIRPKKAPEKPMAFIDLSKSSEPSVLEDVVSIGRMGGTSGYAAGAMVERVAAVVTKPRKLYAMSNARIGGPVLTLDGKAVGIGLWRITRGGDDDDEDSDWNVVSVPCAAVLKAAEHAKNAEPEKPKPAPADVSAK